MPFDLQTAPSGAVVPLHDLKRHLRISHDDEDATIAGYEQAAAALVETYTGRSLLPQTWRLTAPGFPTGKGPFELAHGPVTAITAFAYKDANNEDAALTSADYAADLVPLRPSIVPAVDTDWPNFEPQPQCVRITYTTGYADRFAVPMQAKQAIMLLVGQWFENREAGGGGQVLPYGVEALLAPLQIPFMA